MKLLGPIFVILLSVQAQARFSPGSCQVYQDLSAHLGCDQGNYLTRFGHHYCRLFEDELSLFSDGAQRTLIEIKLCLQQALINAPDLTCENAKQIGVGSHLVCYRQAGYCEMSPWDKALLGWLVLPSITDPDLLEAIRMIGRDCREQDWQ